MTHLERVGLMALALSAMVLIFSASVAMAGHNRVLDLLWFLWR